MDCYCGKKSKARGMCSGHYEAWRRANPGEVVNRSGRWDEEDGSRAQCQYKECRDDVRTQGMCMKHYQHLYYETRKRQR